MVKQLSWLLTFLTSLILFWNIPAEHLTLKWAIPKQFPYQVFYSIANYTQNDIQWMPQCSGTIIAKNAIVTAACCLDTKFDLARIYFGAVNISNPCEIGQIHYIVNRSNFVVNADYNPVTLDNNIAIIKLPFDLEFNEYVQAALLPGKKSYVSSYAGQNMIISGWHKSYKNSPDIVLGFVETQVMMKFGKDLSFLRYKKELTDVANVGSPIVIHNANGSQNIAVGMFAIPKAHLKHMKRGFFVNLFQFILWILDVIKGN